MHLLSRLIAAMTLRPTLTSPKPSNCAIPCAKLHSLPPLASPQPQPACYTSRLGKAYQAACPAEDVDPAYDSWSREAERLFKSVAAQRGHEVASAASRRGHVVFQEQRTLFTVAIAHFAKSPDLESSLSRCPARFPGLGLLSRRPRSDFPITAADRPSGCGFTGRVTPHVAAKTGAGAVCAYQALEM